MENEASTELGEPDLKIEGLRVWVHGREFPDSHDHWDGNWLNVTAHCSANGASVFATGMIIRLPELDRWRVETERLLKTLDGEANLVCTEPKLSVNLKSALGGHITMEVSITPDHMVQRHWFAFYIDQTYLTPLLWQCESILGQYPIRG